MMGKYFGTDGFRGEANVTLTADHAYRIGRFLGYIYRKESKRPQFLIGKDTRRSSDMFEGAISAGLMASGADVLRLGVVTTPAVAYLTRIHHAILGIMISASHNSFTDNGIKLINAEGEKEESIIPALEAYLDGEERLPFAILESIGTVREVPFMIAAYEEALRILPKGSCRGYAVGLDCANGSTFRLARAAFEYLGATVTALSTEPDGVNINRGCGSTHPEALRVLVREKGLDIGFAFDGDGDRCIVVDEKGEIADGDALLYLFARFMKKNGLLRHDGVVCTVMSGLGLTESLRRVGIDTATVDVGDKHVWERMRSEGFSLGGEQAGHIILADHMTTGDGILTAVYTMGVLLREGRGLHALLAGFERFPQMLKNIRVDDKNAVLADAAVCESLELARGKMMAEGRILLRASGTEPVVRIMAEAKEMALCRECITMVEDAVLAMQKKEQV